MTEAMMTTTPTTITSRPATSSGGREGGALSPIVAVVGIAVVAFVVAVVAFRGGSSTPAQRVATGGQPAPVAGSQGNAGTAPQPADPTTQGTACSTGKLDPAYTVSMASDPSPPRAEGTTFHLTVRHDGKAVTGAKVCMVADMTEMHHEGIDNVATETPGGRYDTMLKFGMRGPYGASVVIVEGGKAAVSVPVTFPVN